MHSNGSMFSIAPGKQMCSRPTLSFCLSFWSLSTLCQLFLWTPQNLEKPNKEMSIPFCQWFFLRKKMVKLLPLEMCHPKHVPALLVPTVSPAYMAEHDHPYWTACYPFSANLSL